MEIVEIETAFAQIVAESIQIDASQVVAEATLDELGAESLDVVEISMEVESKFNVWLPDKSILDTAIEVAGRDAILQDGSLTELGKEMFRARMPREEWSLLEGEVTTSALHKYFMRVSTWVRMIADLREHTPKSCVSCGGKNLGELPGFRLSCADCGTEMKLRPGQDFNREWVEQYIGDHIPVGTGMSSAEGASSAAG